MESVSIWGKPRYCDPNFEFELDALPEFFGLHYSI